MVLVGEDVLSDVARHIAALRKPLTLWAATVRTSEWQSIVDVRKTYPTADGVKLGSGLVITIFNIKGNEYRLLSWIDYALQAVEVLAVLTHADYDKGRWKQRYA